jgi:hypothetical protein
MVLRLMKRCDEISRRYGGADIYLLVRRNYRHYQYNSTRDPTFPMDPEGLVRLRS